MACTDMAILEHSVVKSYGGGVYRRGRLLLSIVNAAKEMGYTALRDKPEKEAVFLGKDVFVSRSVSDGPDSTRCCVTRLCLLESSGSEQQHSEHHFMTVKSIYESHEF